MTSKTIKINILKVLENIDDPKFLKAVFEIVSAKANKEHKYELTEEQQQMLEEREAEYLQGKGKSYSWKEVKKGIRSKKNAA